MPGSDERPTFTVRYQLTPADARGVFWFGLREWVPWLIGIVLLTLVCATWSTLGHSGRMAALLFPTVTVLTLLWRLNRIMKAVELYQGREFLLSFDTDGLRLDSAMAKTEIPWRTIDRIWRGHAYWVFSARNGGRFFAPADSIPVEARAFIARWAGDAGTRLN